MFVVRVLGVASAAIILAVGHLPATAQQVPVSQRAESILPPGNSQTYTVAGEAQGQLTGDPGAWGPWIDDQRQMYFDYEMKDASILPSLDACAVQDEIGARDRVPGIERLRDDVAICWDDFGVPAIFGDDDGAAFYGHGWAQAKLRLFLLDAAIRQGSGTLAALAGEGLLAQDIERRTTRYSREEYQAMLDALPADQVADLQSYVDGVNAYIAWVTTAGRDQLPVEYAALTQDPTPIDVIGVAALAVELQRFVASEGRMELVVAQHLRQLEDAYGIEEGRERFLDFFWQEDERASLTILPSEGRFPRTTATATERRAAFEAMADLARTYPLDELDQGPGIDPTAYAAFGDPALDDLPDDGTGDQPFIAAPSDAPRGGGEVVDPIGASLAAVDAAGMVRQAFEQFGAASSEGGSWMVMIAPSRTADGSTLLMSEPQLDYDSNTFLLESQITGDTVNAKGSTVAGIPVVGIGWTPTVAWALTTGNAKTIDTYVETLRTDSNADGTDEYLHDGVWKELSCRDEEIAYRSDPAGVGLPVGPALQTHVETVCRTVHGPIVSRSDDGAFAATFQWHMAFRELDTLQTFLDWNSATTLVDMRRGVEVAAWNENLGAVDSQGNIGYWHPGIHLTRSPDSDLRLPIPGTGEYDNGEPLPFRALPQLVNPDRGWIVNWNNKPAAGWLDGNAQGSTSYPAGIDARNATLADIVGQRDDWTFDALLPMDEVVSSRDFRTLTLLPLLLDVLGSRTDLTATERQALDVLAGWDRDARTGLEFAGFSDTDGANPATVGAAPTIFDEFVEQLDRELFTDVVLDAPSLVSQQYMGRHVYDTDTHLHLALRVLDPDASSLDANVDWTGGRTTDEVLRAVLARTVDQLTTSQGDDPTTWRNVYFDDGRGERGGKDGEFGTAAGVVGPSGRHYYIERGAWVHHVGFVPTVATPAPTSTPDPSATPSPTEPPASEGSPMPTTGGGLGLLAALSLGAAVGLRGRGRRRQR